MDGQEQSSTIIYAGGTITFYWAYINGKDTITNFLLSPKNEPISSDFIFDKISSRTQIPVIEVRAAWKKSFPFATPLEITLLEPMDQLGNEEETTAESKPQPLDLQKNIGGRRTYPENAWAYIEVRINKRSPKEVYPEWRTKIGNRIYNLADPLDSFNKVIKLKREKTE